MAEQPANAQLDAFLSGAPEPEPQQAPAPEPKAPEPPKEPPEPPAAEPDDDGDPPEPSPGEPVVPRRALEDERHKRQNYVAQAAKFEAERDMLAKQLEELKSAPPSRPSRKPSRSISQAIRADPAGNPAGIEGDAMNQRLNLSEHHSRKNTEQRRSMPRSPSSSSTPRKIRGCIPNYTNRPIHTVGWRRKWSGAGASRKSATTRRRTKHGCVRNGKPSRLARSRSNAPAQPQDYPRH